MPYDIIIGRDAADKEIFGNRGLIYLGKGYVKMGNYTSLSNKIWMDVARSHVVLIAGKRGCLDGNTLVFTNRGYKKIKDFDKNADKILSFNKENKKFEWENAELLSYPMQNESLLEIELEDKRKIILTNEHPILISVGKKILSLLWQTAEKLKIGDNICCVNEFFNDILPIKIKKISEIRNIERVYDLTVSKNHSFIANGVISHNSGKSYTIGAIAEELADLKDEAAKNVASLIFDTMGIFWTMKYKNEKDYALLKEWGIETKNLPVKVFIPFGKKDEYEDKEIPFDDTFALKASELDAEDWVTIFNLQITSLEGVLIERVITKLKSEEEYFNINIIQKEVEHDSKASKEKKEIVSALFSAADSWGIFSTSEEGTEISDLITPGTTTVLDVSIYSSTSAFNVRALVISLICRKLFDKRMDARKHEELESLRRGQDYLSYQIKRSEPLVWIFIDEVHEFLPRVGKTPATDALVQLLREGRQPGISLVLATQQPGQIHKDVMTQSDIVISHRITAKQDIEALNEIMQTYLLKNIKQQIDELPALKGSAIILDDNSERIYPVRVRPRLTWHGGESPTAVQAENRI